MAAMLPWNHCSRKNLGYLYAIEQGAELWFTGSTEFWAIDRSAYIW